MKVWECQQCGFVYDEAQGGEEEGTDLRAMKRSAISVTPLQVDMTNRSMLPTLEGLAI